MKNLFAFCLVAASLLIVQSQPSMAKAVDAKIHYGNSPIYGKTMQVINESRVSGRLRDLESEGGGGDDAEFVLACYEGKKSDVCDLLTIAVSEENEKSSLKGDRKLRLSSCEKNKDDAIHVVVDSASKTLMRLPVFTKCRTH